MAIGPCRARSGAKPQPTPVSRVKRKPEVPWASREDDTFEARPSAQRPRLAEDGGPARGLRPRPGAPAAELVSLEVRLTPSFVPERHLLEAEVELSQIAGIPGERTDLGQDAHTALRKMAELLETFGGLDATERAALATELRRAAGRLERWLGERAIAGVDPQAREVAFAEALLAEVESLGVGQGLLITSGWDTSAYSPSFGHAMLLEITRQADATFTLRVFNTGYGIEAHPSQKRSKAEIEHAKTNSLRGEDSPDVRYRTAYVREGVSWRELSGEPGRTMLTDLVHLNVARPKTQFQNVPGRIYERVGALGRPETVDFKTPGWAWQLEQKIGNCTWKSPLAWLRTKVSPSTYLAFKDHALATSIARFETQRERLVEDARSRRAAEEGHAELREAAAQLARRVVARYQRPPKWEPSASPFTTLARIRTAIGRAAWNRHMADPELRARFERIGGHDSLDRWVSEELAPDHDPARGAEALVNEAQRILQRRTERRALDRALESTGIDRAHWRRQPRKYLPRIDP